MTATVRIDRPTLSLRGVTAPGAVVAVTSGDSCPPGGDVQPGAFLQVERADGRGRYSVEALVPGRVMLRAFRQHSYAPRCRSGLVLTTNATVDLPLAKAAHVRGRFVYAGTPLPLVTPLSYQLDYLHPSPGDPTVERPAVARSDGSTGRFRIDELRAGHASGTLATETGEDITDGQFVVVFPFEDGTPYWYDVAPRSLDLPAPGRTLDLGDVALRLHG